MEKKFKIGDVVRCVKTQGKFGGHGWEENIVFTIKSLSNSDAGDEEVAWDGMNGNTDRLHGGVHFHSLELADKKQLKTENKMLKYFKTKQILNRDITLCVVVDGENVRTGYSVRSLNDAENIELGKKISLGRALSAKTNLTPNIHITTSLSEKYILSAIADNIFRDIENGKVLIKGIR